MNPQSSSSSPPPSSCFFMLPICLLLLLWPAATAADHGDSSIIFTTLGRSDYAFDIFALPIHATQPVTSADELHLTDSQSVNFNGHFPSTKSSRHHHSHLRDPTQDQDQHLSVVYVSERNGSSNIYLDMLRLHAPTAPNRRPTSPIIYFRVQVPLLKPNHGLISMKDKPSLVGCSDGEFLIYVSTHENPRVPRASWAAVFSTHLPTGLTRRLTPHGVADFSPAVSPSGHWTAVASYGQKGWEGDVEELATDIYVFRTQDGSGRVRLIQHGGWPSWADDSTLFFHRRGEDGWWSVYRAAFSRNGPSLGAHSLRIERVTPPGLHAFTPAASPGNKSFIAVATRRTGSNFRHIELFDLESNRFIELTSHVSPRAHHFNPFISPDLTRIGYHRCRGAGSNDKRENSHNLFLENLRTPSPDDASLFRIHGSFPSFSPNGERIAFVKMPGLYVVNRDGSNQRKVSSKMAFSTAWDRVREGVVYTSTGPTFATESTEVDVISINVDDENLSCKKLTIGGQNNAFPAPSPDGKWVAFRSGRSGHKNLYIMDAVEGELGGIQQLTNGPWTDTMCNWSPDGEWIAFASDRDNPGGGSFQLYMIHPNGTGLRKLFQSGSGGRANHPSFSPNGKRIVFTSDYAGVSAEPISNPHHYQPYGDIFTMQLDGSDLRRLTHNSYEDGTPTWGPTFIARADVVEQSISGPQCSFEDCHWLHGAPNHRTASILESAPRDSGKLSMCCLNHS